MPRFFVAEDNFSDGSLRIFGEDARHIARALRMAEGDEIVAVSPEGTEYTARLAKIRDDVCECKILSAKKTSAEPPIDITVYMAYPKGDKMETVVQKAVELGAKRIVPFISSRCIKRPEGEKSKKQTERLSRIAEEAAKQCGRGVIPTVAAPVSFKEAVEEARNADLPLFCYEGEETLSLKRALDGHAGSKSVSVTVGSEGGFSPEEAEYARNSGLISVSLGPRILRCETAPSYVLSSLSFFFELS